MDYGMPTLIECNTLRDSMELAASLKLQFVELNMNLPLFQTDRLHDTEALLDLAKEYGLYYTIHLDENLNVWDFNPHVRAAYLTTVKDTIAAAKALSVPIVNMHMNHGIYFTLPQEKRKLFQVYESEYLEATKVFIHLCEEWIGDGGVVITIENTDGWQPYELKALNLFLASPVFGLTWDIGHSHAAKDADHGFLTSHREKLRHFHIHDALGVNNHLPLGRGEIPVLEYLQMAETCHGRCVLETKTIQGLKESVMWKNDNCRN